MDPAISDLFNPVSVEDGGITRVVHRASQRQLSETVYPGA